MEQKVNPQVAAMAALIAAGMNAEPNPDHPAFKRGKPGLSRKTKNKKKAERAARKKNRK